MNPLDHLFQFLNLNKTRPLKSTEAALILGPNLEMEVCFPKMENNQLVPPNVVLIGALGARLAAEDQAWVDELMEWMDEQ